MKLKYFLLIFTLSLLIVSESGAQKAYWKNNGANVPVSESANIVVMGDFHNINGGTTANDGTIKLTGDFVNNSTFNSGSISYVKLEGGLQNIGGTASTTFSNLTIDGDNNKTISINTNINDALVFNADNRIIIGDYNLTLLQNATITPNSYNNSRFVVTNGSGFLVKNSVPTMTLPADTFLFPVGDAVNSYKPVVLGYTGTTDNFSVRVENFVSPVANIDTSQCVQKTYIIQEGTSGGTTSAFLDLAWNTEDEGTNFNRDDAMLWHDIGGTWNMEDNTPGFVVEASTNVDYLHKNVPSGITDFSSANNRFILKSCPSPVADINSTADSICQGDSSSLTIADTTITEYIWNTGDTTSIITVYPSGTTTYTVTMTNYCGSTGTDDIVITVLSSPVDPIVTGNKVCKDNNANLTIINAVSGYTYVWYDAPTGGSIVGVSTTHVVPDVTEGDTLYVETYSEYGCQDTTRVAVPITLGIEPVAGFYMEDTSIFVSEYVTFIDTSINANAWFWIFGDGYTSTDQNPEHLYSNVGSDNLILIVASIDGCVDTATYLIEVKKRPEIFIPSAFSPNNDGSNEMLKVLGDGISNMEFKIFNQWGFKVFHTTDQLTGWDGKYSGQDQPVGNYAYIFNATLTNGDEISKQGIITLVR